MNVKFGIIGFGFMGRIHEEMITLYLDGAEVTAVCDILPKRLNDAITPGVQKFTSVDDLLAIEEIDVVLIAVPNHLHLEMVRKAARVGKDIICEKPAAMNVTEFDEMMAETVRCGVHLTVHQQRRFDKGFQMMKQAYDDGLVGRPYTIQSKLAGYNGNMHDWHVYKKYGGGMLMDWGVHLIDQMVWMMGCPVKTIFADVRSVINAEVDDYFKLLLRFENGMTAEVELGTYFLKDDPQWYTQHWFLGGSKASAYCDGFTPEYGKLTTTRRLLTDVADKCDTSKTGPTRSFGTPDNDLFDTQLLPPATTEYIDYYQNYLAARAGREEYLVRPEEVREVLRIIEAAHLSAQTGHSVTLN